MAENNDALYVGKYFDVKKYVGKTGLYDLVTLKMDSFVDKRDSCNRSLGIISDMTFELINYLNNVRGSLDGKVAAFDIRSAESIDASGLSAIMVYNRINKNNNGGNLHLICNDKSQPEHFLVRCKFDTILYMHNSLDEL